MSARTLAAESLGTFLLASGGTGAAILATTHVGVVGVVLAFVLALAVLPHVVGPVGGCHLNPAVTFGLYRHGTLTAREASRSALAQLAGATLAAALLLLVASNTAGPPEARHALAGAFGVELLLAALLVFTVLAATDRIADLLVAGVPIGFALTHVHLLSMPASGTPWLLVTVPVGGALAGAALHALLLDEARGIEPRRQLSLGSEP